MKMLAVSQNGNDTWFIGGLSIGRRQPNRLIGDKLKTLMKKKKITEGELTDQIGSNFKDAIHCVINDEEIPKDKLVDKLVRFFEVKDDFFVDKELENVLINDNHMIMAEYKTEKRAKEVKEELDKYIIECFRKNTPIIIEFPKE